MQGRVKTTSPPTARYYAGINAKLLGDAAVCRYAS
jgi:hypothetical protein